MNTNPFGLAPIDMQVLHLTTGAGHPMMYGGLGFALNSMHGFRMREWMFRPRFLRMARRGLITWTDWDQSLDHFKNRKIVETLRGLSAIRDMAILNGGDYSWYRHFDPRDLSTLDKYMPDKQKICVDNTPRKVTRKEAFQHHLQNVRKAPTKYFFR